MADVLMGKMVIHVDEDGIHRPAVITRHVGDKKCNLTVFLDGLNDRQTHLTTLSTVWAWEAPFDDNGKPNSWHTIDPREIVVV